MSIKIEVKPEGIIFSEIRNKKEIKIHKIPITAFNYLNVNKLDGKIIPSNLEIIKILKELENLEVQKKSFENNNENKFPEEYPDYENICYDISELRKKLINLIINNDD